MQSALQRLCVKLIDEFESRSTSFQKAGELLEQAFIPGDDLVFQLESGYGLLRVLAVEHDDPVTPTWHLLAFEDLFPDVEAAEAGLANADSLTVRIPHMALTDRAFERTPAARLSNRPVTDLELDEVRKWRESNQQVSDRSALLMLGFR